MRFEVLLDPQAQEFLVRCHPAVKQQLKKRLKLLESNPFHSIEHFEGDHYKFRMGDYRALVDIDPANKRILVRFIDHRSRIYKR